MEADVEKNKVSARLKASSKFSPASSVRAKAFRRSSQSRSTFRQRRISSTEWSLFYGALSRMLDAGIGISSCFAFQADNVENPRLAQIADSLAKSLLEGKSLHQSCTAPEFRPLHVSMIKVGEETGSLPEIISRLSKFEEDQARLQLAIRSAILYPLVLLSLVVLFAIFVPAFFQGPMSQLFASMGIELPLLLRIIFEFSSWLQDFRVWIGFLLFVTIWRQIIVKAFSSEPIQRFLWGLALRVPGLNNIAQTISEQRLASVLAFTRQSGLSAVRSFELVGETLGNPILRDSCFKAADELEGGGSLLSALTSVGTLSASFLTVVAAGEQVGKLPELLDGYAALLNLKIEENLKAAVSVIQPFFLVCFALLVLVLALNIMGPLSQIIQAL